MSSTEIFAVTREFGLSHGDFFRIVPRVWPGYERLAESSVKVSLGDLAAVEITPSEQKYRRLASLNIPYMDITFKFFHVSERQRAEFFEDFERVFQKGGG